MLKFCPSVGLWGRFRGALVVDAASSDTAFGIGLTFEHTCSGENRGLLVGITMAEDAASVLSVTYNGVAMTLVGSAQRASGGSGNLRAELWKLSNPASGAHDVVITLDTVTDTQIVGGAVSFSSAHQTTASLTGTPGTATGSSTTPSASAAADIGDIVIDVVASYATTLTVHGSQNERWNVGATEGAGSTEAAASAGSVTMSWSASPSNPWASIAVAVKPVP